MLTKKSFTLSLLFSSLLLLGHPTTASETEVQTPANAKLGVNLIKHPNAERSIANTNGSLVDVPRWNTQSNFTAVQYSGLEGFPSLSSPGPKKRGNNFYAGGPQNALSRAKQTINISSIASQVDTGNIRFRLSGFFGGYASQEDNARLKALFLGEDRKTLKAVSVGRVSAEDRSNKTGLLQRARSGRVPAGTRFIRLILIMEREEGNYNDGYADNLILKLRQAETQSRSTTSANDLSH